MPVKHRDMVEEDGVWVDRVWVLCHAATFGETIVITKRDYDHWKAFHVGKYEFIAQGRRTAMKQFRELMLEGS